MNLLNHLPRKAFTLVELLVVIGLIGLLAAGLGLALTGDGNRSSALQNAQSTINSLLSGARGQAALSQTEARIFVNFTTPSTANGVPDGFLREFRIARRVGSDWVVVGDGVVLPKGIAVVPPAESTGVSFRPSFTAWNSPPRTTDAFGSVNTTLRISEGGNTLPGTYREIKGFNPQGSINNNSVAGLRIVLSPVDINETGSGVVFVNPEFVRGARISVYGVAELINEPSGFDN